MSMVFSPRGFWFMIILFSSAQSEDPFPDLESIKNQELNKTIQELDNLPKTKLTSSKPFLPFSDLGAPAGPSKVNKERDQVPKSFLHSIHKGIYTTLDKLPHKKKSKINLKKLIGENLGGLSPEEIYYIDKDLLIIKGGDFEGKKYLKKWGCRRKDAKRIRRIKSKVHETPLGLRFTSTSDGNVDNTSSEEEEELNNALPPSSIPTSELSLFLPSFQIQRHQEKQASTNHYLYMPAPLNVIGEHPYILPMHLNYLYDNYYNPHRVNFHPHINYRDKYMYHPHFRRNNAVIYIKWLPVPLKVAHSYQGDTDINYKFMRKLPKPGAFTKWHPVPLQDAHSYHGDTDINYKFKKKLPNPDASWIKLKSLLK